MKLTDHCLKVNKRELDKELCDTVNISGMQFYAHNNFHCVTVSRETQ